MQNKFFIALILVSIFGLSSLLAQTSKSKPKIVDSGVVNGLAKSLPKPEYPSAAQAVKASGEVDVLVTIDETGDVISASAISGHPLLRRASEQAARQAKFKPTVLSGRAVEVTGVIVYKFVAPFNWVSFGKSLSKLENKMPNEIDFENLANQLPTEFDKEKTELNSLIKDAEISKNQAAAENIENLVRSIQNKLTNNSSDLWNFKAGLALGQVFANLDNESILRTNLLKIKELADFPPNETDKSYFPLLASLKYLAKYADKQSFSEYDKSDIKAMFEEYYK